MQNRSLLDALLNSWDRNNTILINLLRALPDGGMDERAIEGSPTVAQLLMHPPRAPGVRLRGCSRVHMIWHEGYRHGQIKLALKAAGRPFDDEEIGNVTWDVWMEKGKWS